ncbi:MAG TPA: hypothetical protein EYQ51_01320 [Alphaproteobacteria bacterium]|nr:hypothetical protein [Alphaproteobacteria bacterium]
MIILEINQGVTGEILIPMAALIFISIIAMVLDRLKYMRKLKDENLLIHNQETDNEDYKRIESEEGNLLFM